MENQNPIHVSGIVQKILKKPKPKPINNVLGEETTLEQINASIDERRRLRGMMQNRWLYK